MEEKYKNELRVIKNYLALNPNKPKYKVAADTGVSLDIIIELIDQGLLLEEAGELKVARNIGKTSEERRKKLVQGLREGVELEKIGIQRSKEDEKSQLLVDLENKKNEIEHIRGINGDNEFTH